MGNEGTVMPLPNWNVNTRGVTLDGSGVPYGEPNGTRWVPAHCDAVLRRHAWNWSPNWDRLPLNTAPDLVAMHLTSVGRGCNMVLDVAPNRDGVLDPTDAATYPAFGRALAALYQNSSRVAGQLPSPPPNCSTFELPLRAPVTRGALVMREQLALGQTVYAYTVEARSGSPSAPWAPLPLNNGELSTIGNHRIHMWNGTQGVVALRVNVSTLRLATGQPAPANLRQLTAIDWSDPALDPLLASMPSH